MAGFMVPRYIELRAALPYSDIGKVQREALRAVTPDIWDAQRAGQG
jgi:acyl-coenzyme A synthetase/AMP-(fatty) acid ligase